MLSSAFAPNTHSWFVEPSWELYSAVQLERKFRLASRFEGKVAGGEEKGIPPVSSCNVTRTDEKENHKTGKLGEWDSKSFIEDIPYLGAWPRITNA
jgi:hypothetical protein